MLQEIYENPSLLQSLNEDLKNDKPFVLKLLKRGGNVLKHVHQSLQDDEEIVLQAIKQNPFSIQYASTRLKLNKVILSEVLKKNYKVFETYPNTIKNDLMFVRMVICELKIFDVYQYCNQEIKNDIYIASHIFKHFDIEKGIKIIEPQLLKDRFFILEVVKMNHRIIQYMPIEYLKEYNFVMKLIQSEPHILKFINDENVKNKIIKDTMFIKKMIRTNKKILECNDEKINSDAMMMSYALDCYIEDDFEIFKLFSQSLMKNLDFIKTFYIKIKINASDDMIYENYDKIFQYLKKLQVDNNYILEVVKIIQEPYFYKYMNKEISAIELMNLFPKISFAIYGKEIQYSDVATKQTNTLYKIKNYELLVKENKENKEYESHFIPEDSKIIFSNDIEKYEIMVFYETDSLKNGKKLELKKLHACFEETYFGKSNFGFSPEIIEKNCNFSFGN